MDILWRLSIESARVGDKATLRALLKRLAGGIRKKGALQRLICELCSLGGIEAAEMLLCRIKADTALRLRVRLLLAFGLGMKRRDLLSRCELLVLQQARTRSSTFSVEELRQICRLADEGVSR